MYYVLLFMYTFFLIFNLLSFAFEFWIIFKTAFFLFLCCDIIYFLPVIYPTPFFIP